jgi:hypothetical protein
LAGIAVGPVGAFDGKELAQALRAGGYAIVLRHGATFSNQADTDPFNFIDIAKQRNLNDRQGARQSFRRSNPSRRCAGWRGLY